MTRLDSTSARLQGAAEALLAVLTGWTAVLAWRGLVEDPGAFTTPLLAGALLVGAVGWVMRVLSGRWYVVLPVQLLIGLLWVQERYTGTWLPTIGDLRGVGDWLGSGALAGQKFVSPVPAEYPQLPYLLLLGGLGIVLAVDLLACTLRRAPLAGLPLLLALTISASLLIQPVSLGVFVLSAAGWLLLIALQAGEELAGWGRGRLGGARGALTSMTAKIGLTCAVVAVLATSVLSAEGRQLGDIGQGPGVGSITTTNPLLDMRRNLRQPDDRPLVQVRTSAGTPTYLRTTVLDDFTGQVWRPSRRTASGTEPVPGVLPPPLGLQVASQGPEREWDLRVSPSFSSRWLPLPFPTRDLSVDGRWRYDPDTLDVVATGGLTTAGRSYSATTAAIRADAALLRESGPAPSALRRSMTRLPDQLPDAFADTAQQVTAQASNDFDRAVALQDWFRGDGGFRYSTSPAPGSGIRTLERFITTDRVGYCEQFSTAMAVMARTLGIPARVSVGFLRPQEVGGEYVFSGRDLHAWPELYFNGVGWLRFEPTPAARTADAPAYTRQPAEQQVPDAQPSAQPTAQPSGTAPSRAPRALDDTGSATDDGGVPVLVWPLGLLLVLLLLGAPRLLRSALRRRRWAAATSTSSAAEAAWADVRGTASDLELRWVLEGTVRQNAAEVHSTVEVSAEAERALADVVRFVEVSRYARGSDTLQVDRVRADVEAWREEMFAAVDPRRARRARWWPRSLLRRNR
ncbi:hypothetical protein GCM10011519_09470 [Marmoricola endophyticus]|uniref:Transglutaminase-like domain-containing protein n=1 Tax=Marmoricola endophyticus TaxID=2040280 RepID=A0A917F0D3_9ACTN|nr:transglutaminaseTgpA domain-containing protein [Marmoricola endophyticus]GGF38023.1 hypothetical protein GCM10011519_09470 [Marmoricola endophyticus]